MFLPDRTHKMLILLNFAQKSLSFHPTLAFGRIFTHDVFRYLPSAPSHQAPDLAWSMTLPLTMETMSGAPSGDWVTSKSPDIHRGGH